MRFRPCIDIHAGKVKQIVGGSLDDGDQDALKTNFQTDRSPAWFADLYRKDGLTGGHIIQLGPGNAAAAREALTAWPGGMQIGGGINADNASGWIEAGAAAVIVTSWVFHDGHIDMARLERLVDRIDPQHLVLDLSCRKQGADYVVVTDRWQRFTEEVVTLELMDRLAGYCCEYLIHAVDVEGRCSGIEYPLVELLSRWEGLPVTYAGGIRNMEDIDAIGRLGGGRIDFTVGSALDIFGGNSLAYSDLARRFS